MCGIVGYIGHRDAYPIIVKGLQRLEYRGYDSAGVAIFDGNEINLVKTKGKVEDLKKKAESNISVEGNLGIGHTRWATHGVPNDVNSHPHYTKSIDVFKVCVLGSTQIMSLSSDPIVRSPLVHSFVY